jgi:hypothetical protein
MKIRKLTLLVVLLFLFQAILNSAPADSTSIIDNIYNYDFQKASRQLAGLNKKSPVISEALNLEIKWWMAMESGREDQFAEFLKTLDKFEKSDRNDLSEIISSTYRMRYYACVNKNYLIPFLYIRIKKQINKVDIAPYALYDAEGSELYFLYKSFFTLVQNSLFINKIFYDSGRKQELIGSIEEVIRNGSCSGRTIGCYFLMKYYMDVEKDKSAAGKYLTQLHLQYPKNKIFSQLLTN